MQNKKDQAQAALKNVPVKPGQHYRHFKGGEYEVVTLAIQEDTLQPLVMYQSLAKQYVWARTLENFTQVVERDGQRVKRFKLITR